MRKKDTQLLGLGFLVIGAIILFISASPLLIPLLGIISGLILIIMGMQILGYPSLPALIHSFFNQLNSLFNNKK